MLMRLTGIVVVVGLLCFGGYKIYSNRVTWSDPKSVGRAFLIALKHQQIDRAKKYYLPDESDAWATEMNKKLEAMRTYELDSFQAAIPDQPVLASAASPKGSTDSTFSTGDVQLSLRQVGADWYVCKSPY